MNLDLLKNQNNLIEFLNNAYKKNRLTHAYIFEGERGSGKSELAHYFACMLYSNGKVDLNSNDSKLILNDEHINVITINPDGKNIKKDQIKSLQEEFSKTSLVKGDRVYIINDADQMNTSSQNSLLKFIEEPLPGIYGILCTTNSKGLLPTIISRCQVLKLNDVDSKILESIYSKNGIDKKNALLLSLITSNLNEALELNQNPYVLKMFELFNNFFNIKSDKEKIKYFKDVDRVITDIKIYNYFIKLLIYAYRDMICLAKGDLNIILDKYADKLTKFYERRTMDDVLSGIELLYKVSNELNNTNVTLKNINTLLIVNLV